MIRLARPGDNWTSPTIWIAYHDGAPFWTEIRQRIQGSSYFAIQRHYDGIGRQWYVDTGNAVGTAGDYSRYNRVRYKYGYVSNGSEITQSMPQYCEVIFWPSGSICYDSEKQIES